jgi:hypothetical protein
VEFVWHAQGITDQQAPKSSGNAFRMQH